MNRCLCLCLLLIGIVLPVSAGNVFFGLERSDTELKVINRGDSSAFYPQLLRLLPDGRWETLLPVAGHSSPAELPPLASMTLQWPDPAGQGVIPTTLPVMVRFFDQAGAGIGQLSLFNHPAATQHPIAAAYSREHLVLQPPAPEYGIRASWLLWGQEEGIGPLAGQPDFKHVQPPARYIVWQTDSPPQSFHLGRGLPAALLLHETVRGFELQTVGQGRRRGREQHAFWLGRKDFFQTAALVATIAALLIAVAGVIANRSRNIS